MIAVLTLVWNLSNSIFPACLHSFQPNISDLMSHNNLKGWVVKKVMLVRPFFLASVFSRKNAHTETNILASYSPIATNIDIDNQFSPQGKIWSHLLNHLLGRVRRQIRSRWLLMHGWLLHPKKDRWRTRQRR